MNRHILVFLGTFVCGALIALVARAAMFNPHEGHEGHPVAGGEYDAMVSNPLAPAKSVDAPPAPKSAVVDQHAGHGSAAVADPAPGKPINTVCAICGMPVDPNVPTAEYQGKTIGFGCKMCPPKFKADPDRYGPLYVRNEVIE